MPKAFITNLTYDEAVMIRNEMQRVVDTPISHDEYLITLRLIGKMESMMLRIQQYDAEVKAYFERKGDE